MLDQERQENKIPQMPMVEKIKRQEGREKMANITRKQIKLRAQKLLEKLEEIKNDLEDLQNEIKTIGLYRNKAKNLQKLAQTILQDFDGQVPSNRKDLESLPGVGRKTTNVVLSVGYDVPAFAVDTHVERISKRLGFAKKDDNVLTVEKKVCRSISRNLWNKSHHQFIFFGRYFCKAQNPNCNQCQLYDMCKDDIKKKRRDL